MGVYGRKPCTSPPNSPAASFSALFPIGRRPDVAWRAPTGSRGSPSIIAACNASPKPACAENVRAADRCPRAARAARTPARLAWKRRTRFGVGSRRRCRRARPVAPSDNPGQAPGLTPAAPDPERLLMEILGEINSLGADLTVDRMDRAVGRMTQRHDQNVEPALFERQDFLGDKRLGQPRIALEDDSRRGRRPAERLMRCAAPGCRNADAGRRRAIYAPAC